MPPAPAPQATGKRRFGFAVLGFAGALLVLEIVLLVGGAGALAAAFAAVVPAPLLVGLVLLIDRYEPEPRRVLAAAFAWGATAAALLAGLFNLLGFVVIAAVVGPELGTAATAVLVAPVTEESLKGAAVLAVYWWGRREFNGVIDGLVYSAMVGLGFAVTENVFYYGEALLAGQDVFTATVVARGVVSPFAHPLFTAMFGIGLALATEVTRWRAGLAALGLLGAMVLHGLWNLAALGGPVFLAVYVVFFVPLFAAVVAVALMAGRREQRLLRTYLWPETHTGLLTADEVDTIASLGLRRQAEREAARAGGQQAQRRRRAFHHAATRLAFLRHRRQVGGPHAPSAPEEDRWVAEVRQRKIAAKGQPAGR